MKRITVDEIEDDGSGMAMFSVIAYDVRELTFGDPDWENSVGSSVELETYGDGELQ